MANTDTFAAFTGTDIELIASSIATAVKDSRKFNSAEHKVAMDLIIKGSKPENLSANIQRIGNISAVSQELAKAGVVRSGDISALARLTAEKLNGKK